LARVEQAVPEAVPALWVVGVRVAQQAVDPRRLGVVTFRTQARGREGARVSVHLALPLQEGPDEGEGLPGTALLEQLVGPLEPRGRRRCGHRSGGAFLRRALTPRHGPRRRPADPASGWACPRTRPRRGSRPRGAGRAPPPGPPGGFRLRAPA